MAFYKYVSYKYFYKYLFIYSVTRSVQKDVSRMPIIGGINCAARFFWLIAAAEKSFDLSWCPSNGKLATGSDLDLPVVTVLDAVKFWWIYYNIGTKSIAFRRQLVIFVKHYNSVASETPARSRRCLYLWSQARSFSLFSYMLFYCIYVYLLFHFIYPLLVWSFFIFFLSLFSLFLLLRRDDRLGRLLFGRSVQKRLCP